MKHSIRILMAMCLLLLSVIAVKADNGPTMLQPTGITQTTATLQATFPEDCLDKGFQYKYGTLPERTEFCNYAIAATGDPLVFVQGTTAWQAVPRMKWVESPSSASATLTAEFSATVTLTITDFLTFDWQTDSEEGVGVLTFYVDGSAVQRLTGQTDFETVSVRIPSGEHTLKWSYQRTSAENVGLGIGRVRNIKIQDTTSGTWITKAATDNSLLLTGLYPGQSYLVRAYGVTGSSQAKASHPDAVPVSYAWVSSGIQQFETEAVSLDTPETTDVTQTTATLNWEAEPGDATVSETLVYGEYAQPRTLSTLETALFRNSAEAERTTSSISSGWGKGSYLDPMQGLCTSNSKAQTIVMEFMLATPSTISFKWGVRGATLLIGSNYYGSVPFYADNVLNNTLTAYSSTSMNESDYSIQLGVGKHTLKWETNGVGSGWYAYIKDLSIPGVSIFKDEPVVMDNVGSPVQIGQLKPNTEYAAYVTLTPAYESELEYGWKDVISQAIQFTTLPVVVTADSVSNLKQASATLNATVDGGDAVLLSKGIQYRNAESTRWSDATVTEEGALLKADLRSLRPSTTYQWRAYVRVEGCDPQYSDIMDFTTAAVVALKPVLISRTQHTAKVQGEVMAGDAVVYAQGLQFRAQGEEDWETVEDLGTGVQYVIEKTNLATNALYQARTYVQPAGNDIIYSDILDFHTKNLEASVDSITDVHQRTVVVHGCTSEGDDHITSRKLYVYYVLYGGGLSEAAVIDLPASDGVFRQKVTGLRPNQKYGFVVKVSNEDGVTAYSGDQEETSDEELAFREALLSPESARNVTVSHDDGWSVSDGGVMTASLMQQVSVTFTLNKSATISFDWAVKGYSSSSQRSSVALYVDGSSSAEKTLYATSSTTYNSASAYQYLSSGTHTLTWKLNRTAGIYGAMVSNLKIPQNAVLEGGSVDKATVTTASFFDQQSATAVPTQTTAALEAVKMPTDETGLTYGMRYSTKDDLDDFSDSEFATAVDLQVKTDGNTLTAQATGLDPSNSYFFSAYVKDANGLVESLWGSFTTLPVGIDVKVSDVTQTTATATVTTNAGSAEITGLQYAVNGNSYQTVNGPIRLTGLVPGSTVNINLRWTVNGTDYSYSYSFKTLAVSVSGRTSEIGQTSAVVSVTSVYGTATLVGQGIHVDGESAGRVIEPGETLRLTELLPNTRYTYRPYVTTAEGGTVYGTAVSFTTKTMTLTTLAPSSISNRSATLNGTIDCDPYSSAEFGFQWKTKTGWTTEPRFTKGRLNDDGSISVALVNGMLQPDTEYEFRTAVRYQGTVYYASSWKDFRTESEFIVYPATAYTVYRTDSYNNRLILCGYYVAGSEDVTARGYEYWLGGANAKALNAPTAAGVTRLLADEDMVCELDLSTLADGVYFVRAFVETATGAIYGNVVSFTVGEPSGIDSLSEAAVTCTPVHHGIVFRHAGGRRIAIYSLGGQTVALRECTGETEHFSVGSGVYVVRLDNGQTFKVSVK